jgi:hypothetical protein
MDLSIEPTSTETYRAIVYGRALHPEQFDLRSRRVIRRGDAELEAWLMPGNHAVRFCRGGQCLTELVTDRETGLPALGAVVSYECLGEHDLEHEFGEIGVLYSGSAHTETLSESLYLSTYRDMLEHAGQNESQRFEWDSPEGPNLSVLDLESYRGEMIAHAYHLIARGGFVLRVQTMFQYEPT